MKKTLVILFLICILPFRGFSQIVDTVDIMKEFDEFSFRDAKVTGEVKDSTRIREHFIGVKWGMSVNNISFSIDYDKKPAMSPKNFGIYYTYYHSLWNAISLFGIETGVQFNEEGYKTQIMDENDKLLEEGTESFQNITFPFVSQFHFDFWNMRIIANLGCYFGYRTSASFSGLLPETVSSTWKKYSYGIIGGGGLAYVFRPFELRVEANYKHNLSNLYDKASFYNDEYWVSTHTSQIIISVGLHCRIGGSSYKIKSNAPFRSRKIKKD
ncbi:MAG: outer membrane beta-barrel protein [Bacteroidales bacterium]|nr:outer membrane beta-barrel protein [Bacteroidales bacterium]